MKKLFLPILAGFIALQASAIETIDVSESRNKILATEIKLEKADRFHASVARLIMTLMQQYHYSHQRIDEKLGETWFDEYFTTLDRNHLYFLQSDIDEFKSYRSTLTRTIRRQGRVEFPFIVYHRYLQRVKDWALYAADHANDKYDFSKEESIHFDRKDAEYCKSVEELHELWRKRFKNSLLLKVLEEEEIQREAEEKKKKAAEKLKAAAEAKDKNDKPEAKAEGGEPEAKEEGGKPEAKAEGGKPEAKPELKAEPPKNPRLVILKRYERYLHRRADVEKIDILEIFLNSLTRIFDPHSAYMAPRTKEDFDINMSLKLTGIGARLISRDGYIEVTEIIPKGPAAKDGRLKAGQRITAVAQEGKEPVKVVEMAVDKAVQYIRGEKGTKVILTVLEKNGDPLVIDIVRDVVELEEQAAKSEVQELPEVSGEKEEKEKAVVISLPSFYRDFSAARSDKDFRSAGRDIRKLLAEAGADTLDGLILDLRGNGGGSLEEAIEIAGLFFAEGPVVQIRETTGRVKKRYDPDDQTVFGKPMVVLVDKSSASASEIVAAALQDCHRAVIIGDKSTHGKGTVQQSMDLSRYLRAVSNGGQRQGGAIKFTIQKFYRINGGSTQKRGVTPDIILPAYTDHMKTGEKELPHVMPWDEIQPMNYKVVSDVRPYLDELRKRSEERRAKSEDFRELIENVAIYGERVKRKDWPLERSARQQMVKEDEEWGKRVLASRTVSRNQKQKKDADKEEGEKEGEKEVKDIVMEEALHVLADLVSLQTNPDFVQKVEKAGGDDLEGDLQ